jgi:hypothetical protein
MRHLPLLRKFFLISDRKNEFMNLLLERILPELIITWREKLSVFSTTITSSNDLG